MSNKKLEYWRAGRPRLLEHFHRPYLAVDVTLLTLLPGPTGALALHVLLLEVQDGKARRLGLPGVLVGETETLHEAAQRAMQEKTGVTGRSPEQIRLVDDVERDPRARVVTVAHADLVPASQLESRRPGTHVVPVTAATDLSYDHDRLVDLAVQWARTQYAGANPDPAGLLEHAFSAAELRDAHAAVTGEELHTTTILKKYGEQLERSGRRSSGRGRPYELFVVRGR